jgi:glycosyltransferase involved in cell wall biosynthesis
MPDEPRIVWLINSFDPGGAERGLAALCREGCFAGHQLTVIAMCRGSGDVMGDIASAPGCRVIAASASRKPTLAACFKTIWVLYRALRAQRADVLVLSLKQANIIGRLMACLFSHLRCVCFEHSVAYRAARAGFVYPPLLRALSFRVDEVWADCRQTLEETRRYYSRKSRREQVVDLFRVDPAITPKVDYARGQHLRLCAAGRLVTAKRFDLLLAAMGGLVERTEKVSLDLYGAGPERTRLEETIRRAGLGGIVTLHGHREDWLAAVRDCDVFVNLSDREGFCIAVAEAMAAGLPVVATDVGGIRDYGIDGVNLVKWHDGRLETLVDKIVALRRDEALRATIGAQAAADMRRLYTAEAMRRRLRQALARAASAAA